MIPNGLVLASRPLHRTHGDGCDRMARSQPLAAKPTIKVPSF